MPFIPSQDIRPVLYAQDLPAYERPDLLEESNLEQRIPPPQLVDATDGHTTYQIVEDSSIRGKDVLIDSLGYKYCLKVDKTRLQINWRCSVRSTQLTCKATVHERQGGYVRGLHGHMCSAVPGRETASIVVRDAKKEGTKRVFDSAAEIVEQVMLDNFLDPETIDMDPTLPKKENMGRQVNHCRRKIRPKDPKDMTFTLDEDFLPDGFVKADIHAGERRHILMATDTMLHHLARAKTWYMDATFKLVRAPFYQLFSIHSFVRSSDCMKQVALMFVIMSGKRRGDYDAVFRAVLGMLPARISLRKCVADFEVALWQSLRAVMPVDMAMQGCLFHFTQAIYRKIQELGLTNGYRDDRGTRMICRKLMALPLLPSTNIVTMFEELVLDVGDDHAPLRSLLQYMRTQWIEGRVFTPVDWSVYGIQVRTNNDVEGWHCRVTHRGKKGQLPFYLLCNLLHTEAKLVTMMIVLVQQERLNRRQRKGASTVNEKLVNLWNDFDTNVKSAMGLLAAGSQLICPRPDRVGGEDE